ncbi:MAG: gliding motility-associated C-terminal domain-containing protein, partial [Bacteroidales bacterium]
VNVGNTTANTIGASNGIGSATSGIFVTSTTTLTGIIPIYITSSTACNVSNNIIGAIATGGTAAIGYNFYGIAVAGSGSHIVIQNKIGSATYGSISLGITGTTTAACFLNGIYSKATTSVSIGSAAGNGNTIHNLCNNSSGTGSIYAISNSGSLNPGLINISYNTIDSLFFTASSSASSCILINNSPVLSTITDTLYITNNTFGSNAAAFTGASGSSGNFYGIYQVGAPFKEVISNNVFNNMSVKTSGNIGLIYTSYTSPLNGFKIIQNNSINTAFARTLAATTSSFYCYYDFGSNPITNITDTISGNNFSNITANTSGLSTFYGIYCADPATNSSLTVFNNTLSNISFNGTSVMYLISLNGFGGTALAPNLVYGNTVSGISSSGIASIYGLRIGNSAQYVNVYNNSIQSFTLTAAAAFYGIYCAGTSNENRFYNNTISGITNTAAGFIYGIYNLGGTIVNYYQNSINTLSSLSDVHGIYVAGGSNVNIFQHQPIASNNYSIYGLSSGGAATVANGITINGGTTVNIFKNNIYNISNSSNGSIAVLVNGLLFSGATTVNAYNNIIGNLTAPAANFSDAIRGISVASVTAPSNYNLYYNSIYLNASSTGLNFGSSGIYHTASSTATTASIALRNNIIVNMSTASGTGTTVAFRRSAVTLLNFSTTSNNNLFYAGTPSATNLLMYDGTTIYQTLANYKTAVTPRDAASITENPNWLSTTGANLTYLHINPTIATAINNGAVNIAGITDDFDGDIRFGNTGYTGSGTAPDIGADEFELVCTGTPAASTINGSGNICIGSSTTLSLSNAYNSPGITYQWKSVAISGGPYSYLGTASSQLTGSLTASTYYICIITCTNSGLFSTTAMATITVSPVAVGGTATASLAVICAGSGTSVTLSGYTGSIQWQSSLNGTNWNNIIGQTSSTLTTANLTIFTYYRAIVTSGVCVPDTSTIATVSISPATIAGTVTGGATVCSGINATVLTLGTHTGTVVKWQSSLDGISWTDILISTTTYTASNLTATTQFRTVVQSGVCNPANSIATTVTVDPLTVAGSVTGGASVCSGSNSTILTLGTHTGTILRWESSIDGGTSWTVIANTTANYTALNLTVTTQYRAVVQSGVCSSANSVAATVTVDPITVAGAVTGGTIVCTGTNSTILTLGTHTGAVVKWQSSLDGSVWTDILISTTTYTATNLTATTQFRAVVQSGVCNSLNSVATTVTVNPANVGGILSSNASLCSTTNSTLLTLTANTGTIIRWESSINGTIWTTISNTIATYTATNIPVTTQFRVVVQSGVCSPAYSSIDTITINTPPTVSITAFTNPSTCAGTNGTATVSTAASYLWATSPVQNTQIATALAAGIYFVTISNGVCSNTTSVTLNDPSSPSITLIANDTTICTGTSVTFTAGGAGAGTYQFFINGVSQGLASTTATFTTSALANLDVVSVKGTLAGCSGNSSVITMLVSPLSNGGVLDGATAVCSNANNTILTLNSYTGNVVRWESSLNGSIWTPLVNTLNTYTANNLTVTTYYRAVVQNGYCGEANSTVAIITVTPLPIVSISYTGSPFCTSLASVNVTQTGTASGTYTVTPAGVTINVSTGVLSPVTSTAGVYTVTYTIAAAGGCVAVSASTPITITTLPAATISYSGTPFCKSIIISQPVTRFGSTNGKYTALPIGLSLDSVSGAINPAISTAGTYTVTYTMSAAGGCATVTATTTATITTNPAATIAYAGSPFCKTLSIAQTVTRIGTTGGIYSVSPSGLTLDSLTGGVIPSASIAGTYTVTYTIAAAGGCATVSTSTSVTITTLPTAAISYTGTPFCKTLLIAQTVTFSGTTGGKYTALPLGLVIDSLTGGITPSSSTAGTYTVTYTYAAAGGCATVSATTSVTITAPPTATITYTGSPYCKSIIIPQTVTRIGTIGGKYTFTPVGLVIDSLTGAVTPSTTTAGTYTVTYTMSASGGCATTTTSTTVTITTPPAATISYAGSPFCKTLTIVQAVTRTGSAGGKYTALPLGLTLDSITGGIIPSTSTAGVYTISYVLSAIGGCATVTTTATITITAIPVATFSYTATPYCSNAVNPSPTFSGGGTAGIFSAAVGLNFVSTATGQVNVASSTATSYTVTNTKVAAGGCAQVTATNTITITTLPSATISYSGTPFCKTLTIAQTVTRIGSASGTYTSTPFGLSIVAATGAVTPSTSIAGNYTVSYTIAAASGCAAVTATATVTVTNAPTATINYAGSPYCKSLTTAQAVTRIGTAGGKYTALPPGLSIDSLTGAIIPSTSIAGIYTVSYTISAAGGCATVTATKTVTITTAPTASISYTGSPFCTSVTTSQAVTFVGTIGGKYKPLPLGLSIDSLTGGVIPSTSTPGTYIVNYTILAAGGCATVTASTTVTITLQPILLVGSNTPICEQDSLNLYSSLIPGAAYSWTGPLAFSSSVQNPVVSVHSSASMTGLYNLSVSGISGGCPDMTANVNVTVNPKPVANFTYSPLFPESNEDINFTYSGTAVNTWNWVLDDQFKSNVENPVFSIPDYGSFLLFLYVENNFGCKDTVINQVFVKEVVNVWIPNAFSPNGDGLNEEFKISSVNKLMYFTMRIYNRWGEIVFETNHVDSGWDGKYRGDDCPIGTYIVVINYRQNQIDRFFEINRRLTLIR